MKVVTKKLMEQILKAKKAVGKSTIEVYEALRVSAKDGILTVAGSCSIITIIAKVEGEGDDEFECAVNANILTSAISKLSTDEVTLEKLDKVLRIKGSKTRVDLPLLDVSAMCIRDTSNDKFISEVDADYLPSFTAECAHALLPNGKDPRMESFHLEFGDGLRVTALDGKRISIRDNFIGELKEELLVHGKPLCEALRLLGKNAKVSVPESKTYLKVSDEECEITISTIDSIYFNIENIISRIGNIAVKTGKAEFLNAIELASLVGDPILTVNNNSIIVTCTRVFGDIEVEVPAIVSGLNNNQLQIVIKGNYLTDAISSIESEDVFINFADERSPVYITATDNTVAQEIILPIVTKM